MAILKYKKEDGTWGKINVPNAAVTSVNGQTGDVVIETGSEIFDFGLTRTTINGANVLVPDKTYEEIWAAYEAGQYMRFYDYGSYFYLTGVYTNSKILRFSDFNMVGTDGVNIKPRQWVLEFDCKNHTWVSEGTYGTQMDANNPTGTGSFSLNRREGSEVGEYSFAEGRGNEASGAYSHAEGFFTKARGDYSHTKGESTEAYGRASYAEGLCTEARGDYSHVQGKFNIRDEAGSYAHIVGNGRNNDEEHPDELFSNAHTLDWEGNAWFAGDVYVGSTSGVNKDEGSKKLVSATKYTATIPASDWYDPNAPVPPTPVPITISGAGNATYCYATINGTNYYGAGTYQVNTGDKITFGVYGRSSTYYGRVTIDGTQALNVTNQSTQTYEWTVPEDTATITILMSYTYTTTQRNGRITVTTTKKENVPDTGGYITQTITINGLKDSYSVNPDFDVVLSGTDADADMEILSAFGLIYIADTGENTLTLKCVGSAPTVNIPIVIKVWE